MYEIDLEFKLPGIGAYAGMEPTEDNYLDEEFHFADGLKDENGNAYFYLISMYQGMAADDIKGVSAAYEDSGWHKKDVDGIKFGDVEWKTSNGSSYYVCKVTVTGEFCQTDDPGLNYIGFAANNGESILYTYGMRIYDFTEAEQSKGLYWFYRDSCSIDSSGHITEIYKDGMRNLEVNRTKGSLYGYIAYKSGTDYYAVNTAELANNTGSYTLVRQTVIDDYTYKLEWSERGKCTIRSAVDGVQYEMSVKFKLPYIGAYKTPEMTEESYLDGEFYFSDSAKDENGNAYFYLISVYEGFEADDMETVFVGYDDQGQKEKTVKGIDFGKVEVKYFNGSRYYVSKVTVTRDFKHSIDNDRYYICHKAVSVNSILRQYYMNIYDCTEIEQSRSLYWIYANGCIVEADGRITKGYEHGTNKLETHMPENSWSGYLAYKSGADYYAVNAAEILNNTGGYELSHMAEEDNYMYLLSCSKKGRCTLQAEINGEIYEMDVRFTLPRTGAYKTAAPSEKSYLDSKFYFADGAKDDNGNAYFYLISPYTGYAADEINAFMGNHDSDDWQAETVKGIEFGGTNIEKSDGKAYYVCKVTVTKEFRQNDDNYWYDIGFSANGGESVFAVHSILIYDYTEIEPGRQLYWFYSGDCNVDSDGKITSGYEYRMKKITTDRPRESWEIYFAYKLGTDYYAVDSVEITENTGEYKLVKKADENNYLYRLSCEKRGNCKLRAEVNGTVYEMNAGFELPYLGAYRSMEVSEDSYLDGEFHFADETKDKDGNAYFYLISPYEKYETDDIQAVLCSYIDDDWKLSKTEGINFGKVETKTLNGSSCYVCKVTVTGDFQQSIDENGYHLAFAVNNGSDIVSVYSMNLYDCMEIEQNRQLYWFQSENVTVTDDGQIQMTPEACSDWDSLDELAQRQVREIYLNNTAAGYFAVKKDGGYYAVNAGNGKVLSTDTVSVEKSDYSGAAEYEYCISFLRFGSAVFTASQSGKEYTVNLIAAIPETGFFMNDKRTEAGYLNGEFHFSEAAEDSEGNTYFYLIAPDRQYEIDRIKGYIYDEDEDTLAESIDGISVGKPYRLGDSGYVACKITVTDKYREKYENPMYNIFLQYGDGEDYRNNYISVYDSTEIPEKEQLYWFSDYEVRIRQDADGRLESEDENCTLDECANRILRTSFNNEAGYFAIKKGENEYYAVDSVKAEEFTVGKNKITGLYIVNRLGIGEYYCSAVDSTDGREYRMKVIFKLPDSGFYSSINEQSSDTFLGSFDYNTSLVKAFYYICPEEDFDSIGIGNINAEILKADSENGETVDRLDIGKTGSIVKGSNTYYYWEIKMDDSYSFNREIRLNFSFGDYTAQSEPIKVLGPVECGDADTNGVIDFADVLWLKRHVAEWNGYSDIYMKSADVSNDGKADEADIMILERYLAGWTGYEKLPYLIVQ